MNITQLKQTLPFLFEAKLAANIIGKHGVGKSSIVAQFAKENGYSYHPFFLGQLNDMGDVLGLPEFNRDENGKATSVSFVHPEKLPKTGKSILHFDELNRASKDLLQGIFQLALEGSIHDYTLPKDSVVIFSMNPATDDYSVIDFADKAFADRFVHINLDPTHEEFHLYMENRYEVSNVSQFLKHQTKLLEESDLSSVSLDFVKPSRRSWDRLQKLENTNIPENLFREAGMGIVGTAAMIAYSSWKENQIKIITGKDILGHYSKVRGDYLKYFKDLESPRNDIVASVCSDFSEEFSKILKDGTFSEDNAKNALAFLLDSPIENAYASLISLKTVVEFSSNKIMKDHLLENKELIDRIKEARKAKDSYESEKAKKK